MTRSQRARRSGDDYPANWAEIAAALKDRHGWHCERCGHPHDPGAGYTLTVHHLDMDPANCADWNLAILCQRCHLRIQVKVDFEQGYMFEHTGWMKPHVEGFLQAKLESGAIAASAEANGPRGADSRPVLRPSKGL